MLKVGNVISQIGENKRLKRNKNKKESVSVCNLNCYHTNVVQY